MERIPIEYVLEQASIENSLLIVDERVIDLSSFLNRHPGGTSILLAHLGRDASDDFHHVPAHSKRAVALALDQLTAADVDGVSPPAEWESMRELLNYVRIVRNSFEVQIDPLRDASLEQIYVGQLYSHFVGYHIRSFTNELLELTDHDVDPILWWRLDQLHTDVTVRVEHAVSTPGISLDGVFADKMRHSCVSILQDLLKIGAQAIGSLRFDAAECKTTDCADEILHTIQEWVVREYDAASTKLFE